MRALLLVMLAGCSTAQGQSESVQACTWAGSVETRYECTEGCGMYCGTYVVRQYICRGGMWVRQ